jgi:hypothetical protein
LDSVATDGASIRRALPGEADLLTALTLRSKAYWGYDREFMEAARAELTFRPEKYPGLEVYVLETGTRVVGFCSLIPRSAVEWNSTLCSWNRMRSATDTGKLFGITLCCEPGN